MKRLFCTLMMLSCATQPAAECVVSQAPYTVLLNRTSGTGSCSPLMTEVVELRQPTRAALELRARRLLALGNADAGNFWARGALTQPAQDKRCQAETMKFEATFPAREVATDDGGVVQLPALPVSYIWENLKHSAPAEGARFTATFQRTEGDCTERYDALGLSQAMACVSHAECQPVQGVAVVDSAALIGSVGRDGGLALGPLRSLTTIIDGGRTGLMISAAGQVDLPGETLSVDDAGMLWRSDGGLLPASLRGGPALPEITEPRCERGFCSPSSGQ